MELEIRESGTADWQAIETLYPRAFPDEDLVPLVQDLLENPDAILSLVATADSRVAGHVIFTRCGVTGADADAALLAPLAVDQPYQRKGVGSLLVRAGLRQLQDSGVSVVCVLGDPNYYGRFGFVAETAIEPPYPLPAEWQGAWQSSIIGESSKELAGVLSVPSEWRREELWAP